MKKKKDYVTTIICLVICIACLVIGAIVVSRKPALGFNKQIFDLTYKFDRAQIKMPDGSIIEGKVDTWRDYEDGDQFQIVIDGITYLTHATNVVLMRDGKDE